MYISTRLVKFFELKKFQKETMLNVSYVFKRFQMYAYCNLPFCLQIKIFKIKGNIFHELD